jgi:hypothetical protein
MVLEPMSSQCHESFALVSEAGNKKIITIIIIATAFVTTLTRQRGSSGHSQMGSEHIQHSYTIWNHLLEKPTWSWLLVQTTK